ncbi:MAG: adenylyl-sulfate kinase [Oscillospiraceae bacterium]|nr:adenylyl-sulfate kinase [Oscillospiraceae bacterium]
MVYWITGMSGCGKTTLGKALYAKIKSTGRNAVFLDGDDMRKIFCDGLGYTYDDRKTCAFRYSRLCSYLSEQGTDVVCSTVSMFHSVRQWNRENIADYCEIYLKCSDEILKDRDYKNVYAKDNVVGKDVLAETPEDPDLIFFSDSMTVASMVEEIINWRKKYDKD